MSAPDQIWADFVKWVKINGVYEQNGAWFGAEGRDTEYIRADLHAAALAAAKAEGMREGMLKAAEIAEGIAESCAGNVTVYSPPMAGAHEELRLLHTGGEQACGQVLGAIRAAAGAQL